MYLFLTLYSVFLSRRAFSFSSFAFVKRLEQICIGAIETYDDDDNDDDGD